MATDTPGSARTRTRTLGELDPSANDYTSGRPPQRQRLDGKIFTLDDQYDLTLLVGRNDSSDGVVTFRVNKSSLRLASKPFRAMLSGDRFAESSATEITFPDEKWKPFLVFLQVAHLRSQDVPKTMSMDDLVELTTFCEKYDLGAMMFTCVVAKNWLGPYKCKFYRYSKLGPDLQDYAFIAYVLNLMDSFKKIKLLLAYSLFQNDDGTYSYFVRDKLVKLREDLHQGMQSKWDSVLSKVRHKGLHFATYAILAERTQLLKDVSSICRSAWQKSVHMTKCTTNGSEMCAIMRIGILGSAFQQVGYKLDEGNVSHMRGSIEVYRNGFIAVREKWKSRFSPGKAEDSSVQCEWDTCMGDIEIPGLRSIFAKGWAGCVGESEQRDGGSSSAVQSQR
jgi:hypothetical protein